VGSAAAGAAVGAAAGASVGLAAPPQPVKAVPIMITATANMTKRHKLLLIVILLLGERN
jgi:hypothetical protein